MCGIFGVFDRHGLRALPQELLKGLAIASHRGPDGEGAAWFDTRQSREIVIDNDPARAASAHLLLAHLRLAIIDLSDLGRQPMGTDDGQLWITYNGEIYNYLEIRAELESHGVVFRSHSDTEVVLRAYEAWGSEAFSRFVGMWAFAILDFRQRRLVVSRDRFGIKPLHYVTGGGRFAFASEIKQLLEIPWVSRSLNTRAVYDYLQYEVSDLGAETFFDGINRLLPGHNLVLQLDTGSCEIQRYYSPPTGPLLEGISPIDAARRFRELLYESVRVHLRSDVPVGTCLSGGLDSGAIAVLMREISRTSERPVERHAFNCHFDIPEANELEFTRQNIAAAEVQPHFAEPADRDIVDDLQSLVWHQDEPFGSTSIFAQWSVFRLVRDTGVKVVLDGQGADEMLGGYASTAPHFFLEMAARGRFAKAMTESWQWSRLQGRPWHSVVPWTRLRTVLGKLSGAAGPAMGSPQKPWIREEFKRASAGKSLFELQAYQTAWDAKAPFESILRRFFFESNLPALLRFEDRNSMAFSVESRVPFLDHRLVEFAFALPSDIKFRGGYAKRVLRDAMSGLLPEPVRMRARKMGFATPELHWQTTVLKPLVRDAINSELLAGFIDREGASVTLDTIEQTRRLDFLPWRWLNLYMWRKQFNV
ncbi:asparagine synthase (glutamine-hydrolyzing) [Bradyrhizobium sp. AUGA SZCCT0274]|uniref:asparagine synthase (glutamine-hydrolyzing) n=1 Tax=Bradyrhizobium sp. AUGA SZCCT0274 TaxID=2807670 RepID=UPI001BA55992|nr:asparagine synthase (glutamine-hydrolyzing) [Bradyrhizobium sp. AUGA SZCCT0274]MBR1244191.1 asparagine synthase (glutamine-hydrolyzing) [Bradyrhizobium sp. AUGA SZCCT0274]